MSHHLPEHSPAREVAIRTQYRSPDSDARELSTRALAGDHSAWLALVWGHAERMAVASRGEQ